MSGIARKSFSTCSSSIPYSTAKNSRKLFCGSSAARALQPLPERSAPLPGAGRPAAAPAFFSSDEAQLLRELREFGEEYYPALFTLDLIVIWKKKRKVIRFKEKAVALFQQSFDRGGRVFFIGSGTSYHAALTAGYFFNNLTSLGIVPCNPDLFRSVYMNSLRAGDVLVAITQSGRNQGPGRYPEPGAGKIPGKDPRHRRGQQRKFDHSPGKSRFFPAAAVRPGDRRGGHQVFQRPAGPVLPAGRQHETRRAAAAAEAGEDQAPHRAIR